MPGTYVDQKMFVETVPPTELLATVLALVNLGVFVAQSMVVQTVLSHESLATHTAHVGEVLGMINLVIRDQKSTPSNERKSYLVVKTSVSLERD